MKISSMTRKETMGLVAVSSVAVVWFVWVAISWDDLPEHGEPILSAVAIVLAILFLQPIGWFPKSLFRRNSSDR
jgi:hypothetical protein